MDFEILPFSFYEMKQYYELNRMEWSEEMFSDYLKWGGFPLRFDYKDETSVHRYLSNLYTSIVNRDIIGKSRSAGTLVASRKKAFMDISLRGISGTHNAGLEPYCKALASEIIHKADSTSIHLRKYKSLTNPKNENRKCQCEYPEQYSQCASGLHFR